MHTPYDFITLGIFAALIALFLHRAMADAEDPHPLWHYLLPSVGCAAANYVGNEESHAAGILLLVGTLAFAAIVLKPIDWQSPG